jgi:hypothetical protein
LLKLPVSILETRELKCYVPEASSNVKMLFITECALQMPVITILSEKPFAEIFA